MFSLMREILHAWRDVSHSCGIFYMLGVRAWEIVSRRETQAQCVRVDSPDTLSYFCSPCWASKSYTCAWKWKRWLLAVAHNLVLGIYVIMKGARNSKCPMHCFCVSVCASRKTASHTKSTSFYWLGKVNRNIQGSREACCVPQIFLPCDLSISITFIKAFKTSCIFLMATEQLTTNVNEAGK